MQLNIFKSQAAIEALTKDNAGWADKYQTIEKQLSEAQDTIGTFMEEKKTHDDAIAKLKEENVKAIEALTKEHQSQVDKLTVVVADEKNSSSAKAAQILASVGVEAETLKVEAPKATTFKEVLATLKTLKGKEAQDFYSANKAAFADYLKCPTKIVE